MNMIAAVPGGQRRMPSEAEIAELLESLRFDDIEGIVGPVSECPGRGLLDLDARASILWGKPLDRFLRKYLERFPPAGRDLEPEYLEEVFEDVVFEERTVWLTGFVLRRFLAEEKVSLSDLARQVYRGDSQHIGKFRKRLRDRVVWSMEQVALWDVVVITGQTNGGRDRTAGYHILPGPALLIFYEAIYLPRRRRQVLEYCSKHACEGDLR